MQEELKLPEVETKSSWYTRWRLTGFQALALLGLFGLFWWATYTRRSTVVGRWESVQPARHPDGTTEAVTIRYEFVGDEGPNAGHGQVQPSTAKRTYPTVSFTWQVVTSREVLIRYPDHVGDAALVQAADGQQLAIEGKGVIFHGVYTRKP